MGDYSVFSETNVLNEVRNLMINEKIKPEPEYQFFSKYLVKSTKENLLEDEDEILHLINCHGVQLRNDIKYWKDKNKSDYFNECNKKQIPVLNPKDFQVESLDDVIKKLQELPSEWTIVQVTKKFSLKDVTFKDDIPEIYLTRLACGNLAKRIHPYSVSTADSSNFHENIFKVLKNLTEMRKEFLHLGRTNKKLYGAFYKTNTELQSFIKELELYVLGPWVCLFCGRLEDFNLERETLELVRNLLKSYCEEVKIMLSEKQIDIIYHLTLAAHLLKSKTILKALLSVLCPGDEKLQNFGKLMMLVENIKMLNLSNSCAVKRAQRKPLILILDNEFEMVPWEMIGSLLGQPVCRILSFQLLYALYKYHKPSIRDGFRVVETDCIYCLINPSQDLKEAEKEMKAFLKKRIPWADVELGRAPDPKDLLSKIEDNSVYLYCGHGSGGQYLKTTDLKKSFVKGLILLFGCSSNIPKNCGGRTPHQNHTYTYIINGCPCIVGCIQDLSSTDADKACKELLSSIMPAVVSDGTEKDVLAPKEPDVLKALALGRQACNQFWSKSAFVARGIPCKIAIGDVNILKIAKFI